MSYVNEKLKRQHGTAEIVKNNRFCHVHSEVNL